MTKEQFKAWLQDYFDGQALPGGVEENKGDEWRSIEDQGLLGEIGVTCAWDWVDQTMYFRCDDGLLASGFEIGIEQETIWFFTEGQVEHNLRDSDEQELGRAVMSMSEATEALQKL